MAGQDSILATMEEYLTYCAPSCSNQTLKQYRLVLTNVLDDLGGKTRLLDEVGAHELERYQERYWSDLKPRTVAGYVAILKTFFLWARGRGYIDHLPVLTIPKIEDDGGGEPTLVALPEDQLRKILDYAHLTSARNYAVLMFLISTGCKVSGLVSLGLDDVHLNNRTASIRIKSGEREEVSYAKKTKKALIEYMDWRPQCDHDLLWVSERKPYPPLKAGGVYAMLVDTYEKVKLPHQYYRQANAKSVGINWRSAGIALGLICTP